MGIEGFLKRLRDAGHGKHTVFGRSGSDRHTRAIIDGPSLAHHIYSRLSNHEIADSSIPPKTTYRAIVENTLEWLEMVQRHGVQPEAIFFDGALPTTKQEIRSQRLTKYTEHLTAYHHVYNEHLRRDTRRSLLAGSWAEPRMKKARKDIAPPAFLVAAVVESLLCSRYADICHVVPDEADRYCVAAARRACSDDPHTGVCIFTNDSDLIVFDAGPKTSVVLFNDLTKQNVVDGGQTTLSGIKFQPQAIKDSYALSSLVDVAFVMKSSRSVSFAAAVGMRATASSHPDFAPFALEYEVDHLHTDYDMSALSLSRRDLGNGLDARLSELLPQLATREGRPRRKSAAMYLPFLLENPSAASAWRVGVYWRAIAYHKLLTAIAPSSIQVEEFKRQGARVVGSAINLTGALQVDLNTSFNVMESIEDESLSKVERWRFVVMRLTIEEMIRQGAAGVPTDDEVIVVLAGLPITNWKVIHLSARYQAMFYSMRICWQALRYVFRSRPDELSTGYIAMLMTISSLPSIADFFEPAFEVSKAVCTVQRDEILDGYRNVLRRLKDAEPTESEEDKVEAGFDDETTSQSYTESSSDDDASDSLVGNPFAVLARG